MGSKLLAYTGLEILVDYTHSIAFSFVGALSAPQIGFNFRSFYTYFLMGLARDPHGRLIAIYGISADQVQRAAVLAGLSLLFSAGTTVAFLLTHGYLLLLLAFGFFIIGATSLVTLIVGRRSYISLYEGGMQFRKFECAWDDIESVEWVISDRTRRLAVKATGGQTVLLPGSVGDIESLKAILIKQSQLPPDGDPYSD